MQDTEVFRVGYKVCRLTDDGSVLFWRGGAFVRKRGTEYHGFHPPHGRYSLRWVPWKDDPRRWIRVYGTRVH